MLSSGSSIVIETTSMHGDNRKPNKGGKRVRQKSEIKKQKLLRFCFAFSRQSVVQVCWYCFYGVHAQCISDTWAIRTNTCLLRVGYAALYARKSCVGRGEIVYKTNYHSAVYTCMYRRYLGIFLRGNL